MIRSRRQTAQTPIIFCTAFSDEMHTAQGYSLGAVDYILTPVVPEILRTKVGVFVDLYKKTQQVKRQAEEHVALARAQAARAAAEEATRRSAFLAEASTVLARSLDYEAIPAALAGHSVPFLGDLCAVALIRDGNDSSWRTELAWIDPHDGSTVRVLSPSSADLGPISEPIRRVTESGEWEIFRAARAAGPSARGAPTSIGSARSPARASRRNRSWPLPLKVGGNTLGAIALAIGDGRSAIRSRRRRPCPRPRRPRGHRHRQRPALPRRPGEQPPQERVPGDARPRAAQPPGAHPQRRRDPADARHPRPQPPLGQRHHHSPGRATRPAGRRPARHLADHRRQDPAPHGAGGCRRSPWPAPSRPAGR